MRSTLIIFSISTLLFAGCSNADSAKENIPFDSSIVSNTKPANTGNVLIDSTAPVQSVQNNIQPVPTTTATVPVPTTTTTATVPVPVTATAANNAAATIPGMNPPHGQPGHRCDITVGAPLNSPPAKTATTTTGQPVITSSTPAQAKTAPGMNPAHGQPGHRCDIAVGAPLNSPPAKTVVPKTETITKSSEVAPVITEKTVQASANDSSKKQ